MRFFLIFCVVFSLAKAQEVLPSLPVQITSKEGIVCYKDQKKCTATQDAHMWRDNWHMTSYQLTAFFRETPQKPNELFRLEATGQVHGYATDSHRKVWGDQANYDIDREYLTMTGRHLKLELDANPKEILTVTSQDSLEYDGLGHVAYAKGDAKAVKGTDHLWGDSLEAYFDDQNQLKYVDAVGNARMVTPSMSGAGDYGRYMEVERKVYLKGHVRIENKDGVVVGPYGLMDLDKDVSSMVAFDPFGTDKPAAPTRVKMLIFSKE